MSIEGASDARKHHFEVHGNKSIKGHKRKVRLDAEKENAEDIDEVPNFDEAVPTITGSKEAQSVPPLKESKKKEKVFEEQVQGSRAKTQENEQQRSQKWRKRVKFDLESNMSSDQRKKEPMEEDIDLILGQRNGMKEDEMKKPIDTTWVQKASWKSLVGETGRVSFSLGSLIGHHSSKLPSGNIESASTGLAKPPMDVQSSNIVSAWIEGSSSDPLFESSSPSGGHSSLSHVKNTSKLLKKSESQIDLEALNHQSVKSPVVQAGVKRDPQKFERTKHENAESLNLKQAVQSEHQNGVEEKVCRFMRSDNYEQEWLEAKRAVKDIFKRSRKDAFRSMKMFLKKHNQ